MQFLGPTLIVFAILIAVAIAAVKFEPANPLEKWHRLMDRYGTNERPSEVQFTGQVIRFGGERGGLQPLNPFVSFDAAIDDFGLWLIVRATDRPDDGSVIKVPGTHVRPAAKRGRGYVFALFAEPPVRISVGNELGGAVMQKSRPMDPA